MIETLHALPDLTRRWIAPLKAVDRELYDEMAESLVVEPARRPVHIDLPAGVSDALSQVELCGKAIGGVPLRAGRGR